MSEPLDSRTQSRVNATIRQYRSKFAIEPKSSPAPKISPPVAKPIPVAPTSRQTVQAIVKAVSEAWDVSVGDLYGPWRPNRISYPRFAIWRLLRKMTDLSYPEISKMFGKDHASVMSGVRRSNDLMHEDSAWRVCFNRAVAALENAGQGCPAGGDTGTRLRTPPAPVAAKPKAADPLPLPRCKVGSAPDGSLPSAAVRGTNSGGAP